MGVGRWWAGGGKGVVGGGGGETPEVGENVKAQGGGWKVVRVEVGGGDLTA